MKVEVIKMGYWEHKRRKEGEILEIDPKEFSSKWMRDLSEPKEKKEEVKKEEKKVAGKNVI